MKQKKRSCSKLEAWKELLESKDFRINRFKTEYMNADLVTREKKIMEQLETRSKEYPKLTISIT